MKYDDNTPIFPNRTKKLVGWQIVNEKMETPKGFWSWEVIRDFSTLIKFFEHQENKGFHVIPIYDGDIEDPAFRV